MAKRMLHDNICRSRKIDMLSPSAEVLYYRLYTQLDDCGNFPNNITMIKGHCYPLKSKLNSRTIQKWLNELAKSELVVCVKVGDEQLVHFQGFEQFQTLKHRTAKFGVTNKSQNGKLLSDGSHGHSKAHDSPVMGAGDPMTEGSCSVSSCVLNENGSQEKLREEKITRVVVNDQTLNQEYGTDTDSQSETESGIEDLSSQSQGSSSPYQNEVTPPGLSTPLPRGTLRDWAEDVDSIPGADIRRAIIFHLEYNANTWYRDKLNTAFVRRNAQKLVDEVPEAWNIPKPNPIKRANPECSECGGQGGRIMRIPGDIGRGWMECACVREVMGG